jgi:hypothetical protein
MSSPFDGLTFVVIDYSAIPSGWSNQEKRDSRKRVNRGVGNQSNVQPHTKTHHRQDLPTLYDDVSEITQTANKALYSMDWNGTGQELIDLMIAEIADELNKTELAVSQKLEITIVGNWVDAIDYIAANKVAWGEAT